MHYWNSFLFSTKFLFIFVIIVNTNDHFYAVLHTSGEGFFYNLHTLRDDISRKMKYSVHDRLLYNINVLYIAMRILYGY